MNGFERQLETVASETRSRKFFTLSEANRALVLVRKVVADIVTEYARMIDTQEMAEAAQCSGQYSQCQTAQDQLVDSVEQIQTYAEELEEVGVDLGDWTQGVVGFPCMVGGREVTLCWQPDEEAIKSWHEVDSDFSRRKAINLLPIKEMMAPAINR